MKSFPRHIWHSNGTARYFRVEAVAVVVGIIGVAMLTLSRAATGRVVIEAEDGTIAGNAVSSASTGASQDKAVKFGASVTPPPASDPKPIGVSGTWKLTYSDEFDGTSLDTSKWLVDDQGGNNDDETACFSPEAVSVSDGNLNISLTNKSCHGKENMGGQVHTNFRQAYGFFEARMNIPGSNGSTYNFPAFWLNPTSGANTPCWPTGGEIDIMETISGGASAHYGYGDSCDNVTNNWPGADPGGGDWSGWHTFAVDWEPGKLTFYYDGKSIGSINSNVKDTPMNVLVDNVSRPMGGKTVTGVTLKTDYVRVWSKQ